MSTVTEHQAVIDEGIWQAWIEEGKRREAATARKAKLFGGIIVALAAIGGAFYLLAIR